MAVLMNGATFEQSCCDKEYKPGGTMNALWLNFRLTEANTDLRRIETGHTEVRQKDAENDSARNA